MSLKENFKTSHFSRSRKNVESKVNLRNSKLFGLDFKKSKNKKRELKKSTLRKKKSYQKSTKLRHVNKSNQKKKTLKKQKGGMKFRTAAKTAAMLALGTNQGPNTVGATSLNPMSSRSQAHSSLQNRFSYLNPELGPGSFPVGTPQHDSQNDANPHVPYDSQVYAVPPVPVDSQVPEPFKPPILSNFKEIIKDDQIIKVDEFKKVVNQKFFDLSEDSNKKSFRRRFLAMLHPDKNPQQKERATEVFRVVNENLDKIINELFDSEGKANNLETLLFKGQINLADYVSVNPEFTNTGTYIILSFTPGVSELKDILNVISELNSVYHDELPKILKTDLTKRMEIIDEILKRSPEYLNDPQFFSNLFEFISDSDSDISYEKERELSEKRQGIVDKIPDDLITKDNISTFFHKSGSFVSLCEKLKEKDLPGLNEYIESKVFVPMREGDFESLRELGLVSSYDVKQVKKSGSPKHRIRGGKNFEIEKLMSLVSDDTKMKYHKELSKYGFLYTDIDFQKYLKNLPYEQKEKKIEEAPETIHDFLMYARVYGYQDDDLGLITKSLELGEDGWDDFFKYYWELNEYGKQKATQAQKDKLLEILETISKRIDEKIEHKELQKIGYQIYNLLRAMNGGIDKFQFANVLFVPFSVFSNFGNDIMNNIIEKFSGKNLPGRKLAYLDREGFYGVYHSGLEKVFAQKDTYEYDL